MTHEKTISDLAYHLWRARGCPNGSSEIDWAEAERQVRGNGAGSSDRALDAPVAASEPVGQPVAGKPVAAEQLAEAPVENAPPAAATPVSRGKKKAKR